MRVTEIKFTRRYNVGQYEHEEYGVTAHLEEDDSSVEAFGKLKSEVATAYAGEQLPTSEQEEIQETEVEEVEEVEEEENEEAEEVEETEEEAEEVEEETEEEDEEEQPKKAKKKFKAKAQGYDRSNATHKELFTKLMHSLNPDWKKTAASKAKAKDASKKMEGKDFLDENGDVIAAFKAEVKKLMKKK